jgi:putative endonuclease
MRRYFVYILSSESGTLYAGVTSDIWFRILTHKLMKQPGFTQKYKITRLIYFEETQYVLNALEREKEIKGWSRKKKLDLVRRKNPKFEDLAADWYSDQDFE